MYSGLLLIRCKVYTCIVGYFRGVYILLRISQNENFREDCTHKVAALGTWVWFSINFAKIINSVNCCNFKIVKYTALENNSLYDIRQMCGRFKTFLTYNKCTVQY